MNVFTARELEEEYGLKPFNTTVGENFFESEDPNPLYKLADVKLGVYDTSDYSFEEGVNSFNPSGEEYVVEVNNSVPAIPRVFLEGPEESIIQLDRDLMEIIEPKASPEYYKQII